MSAFPGEPAGQRGKKKKKKGYKQELNIRRGKYQRLGKRAEGRCPPKVNISMEVGSNKRAQNRRSILKEKKMSPFFPGGRHCS